MNAEITHPTKTQIDFSPSPFVKHFMFKSGENQVQLQWGFGEDIEIFFPYRGDGSLFALAMLVDALRRQTAKRIDLVMPYFPGARQDRVCNTGESFSLKVYTDFINGLKFEEVTILDPHSEVVSALLDRCNPVNNHLFVDYAIQSIYEGPKDYVLVSPDAGANKKIFKLASVLGGPRVIRADKIRDTKDGKIVGTEVYADDLTDQRCIIVDDIISGGRTFMELAKILKQKNAKEIILIVTHNEGVAVAHDLKASGIDRLFCTNSMPLACLKSNDFMTVFDCKEYI